MACHALSTGIAPITAGDGKPKLARSLKQLSLFVGEHLRARTLDVTRQRPSRPCGQAMNVPAKKSASITDAPLRRAGDLRKGGPRAPQTVRPLRRPCRRRSGCGIGHTLIALGETDVMTCDNLGEMTGKLDV